MKRLIKVLLLCSAYLLFFTFIAETYLRYTWVNPYKPNPENVYLHPPSLDSNFEGVDQIYDLSESNVHFATSAERFIDQNPPIKLKNIRERAYALAVGGSTTECSLVPENKRWPDLIAMPTLNYGRSRLDSPHSLANLEFLLQSMKLRPKYVFVMDGINNLSRYLSLGEEYFTNPYNGFFIETKDAIARNFYLGAFLWTLSKSKSYIGFYQQQVEKSNQLPLATDEHVRQYWENNRDKFYKVQYEIFDDIKKLCDQNNSQLILLTQPHSYQENYKPFKGNDLRTTPHINGERLSLKQAKEIMDLTNEITKEIGKNLSVPIINTAACLEEHDSSDLLYDSVHFTRKGSEYFAECVNRAISDL